jgi:excisionase family DNA binding protein
MRLPEFRPMSKLKNPSKVIPLPSSPSIVVAEPLWTKEEAAAYLKVEPTTIYQLTRKRSRHPLPCFVVGKYKRFRKSEIDRWLLEGRAA